MRSPVVLHTRSFSMSSSPTSARPYRSKRHRPCDQCRSRKLGCQTDDGIPCQRCRAARLDCTFENPPPKRARLSEPLSFAVSLASVDDLPTNTTTQDEDGGDNILVPDIPHLKSPTGSVQSPFPSLGFGQVSGPSPASGILLGTRPPTQFVQSIDRLENGHAQLFGASAESDPWLLRH